MIFCSNDRSTSELDPRPRRGESRRWRERSFARAGGRSRPTRSRTAGSDGHELAMPTHCCPQRFPGRVTGPPSKQASRGVRLPRRNPGSCRSMRPDGGRCKLIAVTAGAPLVGRVLAHLIRQVRMRLGRRPAAGLCVRCVQSEPAPDHDVLVGLGRAGQAPEVGPDRVCLALRIHGDPGVVADEAAGEQDVGVG